MNKKKRLISLERADLIEKKITRFDKWMGMLWQRFWAIVLFIPSILIFKSCIAAIVILDWMTIAVCGLGGIVFLSLSIYLWRRGGKDGIIDLFFD